MTKHVHFKNYICNIELGFYGNDRLAIRLKSAINDFDKDIFIGAPIAVASVNMHEQVIEDNEIFLKISNENEGMLEAMQNSGYVDNVISYVTAGYTQVVLVRKTEELLYLEADFRNKTKKIKI